MRFFSLDKFFILWYSMLCDPPERFLTLKKGWGRSTALRLLTASEGVTRIGNLGWLEKGSFRIFLVFSFSHRPDRAVFGANADRATHTPTPLLVGAWENGRLF